MFLSDKRGDLIAMAYLMEVYEEFVLRKLISVSAYMSTLENSSCNPVKNGKSSESNP